MTSKFSCSFVSIVPSQKDEGIIYVCLPCNVAVHLCACGCKEQVVTPIDPKGWTLVYDGECVSFNPSIGNWSFPCESHYYIRENRVIWVEPFSHQVPKKENAHKRRRKAKVWDKLFGRHKTK